MLISVFCLIPVNLTEKSYAQGYAQVLGSYAQVLESYAQSYAQPSKHYKINVVFCIKSIGYDKSKFHDKL